MNTELVRAIFDCGVDDLCLLDDAECDMFKAVEAMRSEGIELTMNNIIEEIFSTGKLVIVDAFEAKLHDFLEEQQAADETVEYGVFVWDKERGIYIPIGRPVGTKQLCLNRYRERVKGGYIPEWLDPEKFKILKRTVVEIVDEWKEDKEGE